MRKCVTDARQRVSIERKVVGYFKVEYRTIYRVPMEKYYV